MAGHAAFKILIAYEGFERFDVMIRPKELAARADGQLPLESDIESGSGKPTWPGRLYLRQPSAKSCKILH